MNVKKKARRVMSGLLTAVTVLSTVLSPAVAYASDDAGSVKKIPYYEEIKDQLDEDEVVTAKDYEIKVGDNFDVKSDYTGLTIQDDSKVKVTFQEAKDTDGNDFSTDYANSYKAVYYVEPQTTDHPTYQINRKIVVKEADQQKDSQSESSSDQDAGSSDKTETEDSEADSSTEETDAADTESKTELTEKEFDAEIEATEDQETVDPETGITLSEVMQEAVDQEVALADLEAGESITFDMPMMLASGETGTKSVTVTAGSWYYYADYGLGSYLTCPYYVKWGSINATAYCVEPSKKGPGNGTYTIQKLADGKTLAKVCYYGTKASDENGFFDEKHPDFPAGKRFIITHLAAAYANGSSDWASGTNATGKNLAMELYNYCVNMPDIPSVDMSFSESNVKAYVEGNSQRTSVITFKADKLQTITFKLPSGVKLVNVSTGKTSAAGASVEISGGTQFYLTAPLDQAESVSATFSSQMKGSIDKEYSAYKIVTGSGTQDLALVFGEGVGNEKYVDFKVTWTKECKVSIVKKDQDTGNALAGAVYGIYSDAACTKLIAEMPATDQNGASQLTMEKTQEVVYLKEISVPTGYQIDTKSYNVTLAIGKTTTKNVTDKRVNAKINIAKQDAETGNTVAGAVFGIYNAKDIQTKDGKVIVKADTLLQEMTSDEKGQAACTLDLPLGSYYVKELKAPDGFVSSDEVLRFDASYQGQDVQTVTLKSVKKNQPTTVEITKSDATTGVELDGAYLKVTDKDGNVVDSWTSSKDAPHVIKYLKVGENYTLHEEFAPHGYLVANDVIFTVKDTAEVQKVEMKDEVPKGLLIINKKGEFLDSFTLADKVKGVVEHIFNYVTGKLTDVTFEVYAEEDIKAADGVSDDYYKKDELIATIKTDETGIAKLENLPLGKYYVKETGTAYGHVLDGEIRHVDLTYVDQNTPVVVYDKDWQNNRQRVEVSVLKKEKDSDRTLEGAIFGLFAKDDIKSETTGKVLIEADEIIELKSTDEEGKITFVADLPIGATYYVKELYAPDGFVTNDEGKEFTFEYAGEDQPTVTYDFTFENQPTIVEFTKSSLTTGKELPGCKLKVVDADGNIVDEWTSGKEAHVIRELTVGKEYTLVETKPADGYVTAESVKFTIKDTADVQKVEMKDDVTKVKISKQDIAGKELPGAKLTILDQDGKVVESWTSTEKAHYIEMLPIGKYTLREETAPDGYLVAKDVEFEVKDTCEVQHVTMVDEKKPAEKTPEGGKPVSDSPKTGDNTNLWLWFMLLGIGATGTGALAFMRKKKH